ncbi:MAG: Uncharacterised protein [Flavobacteriia bacterium]|nr:MAG: Uncharacterised protein [Flavobacteriia bacterium]
MSPVPGAWKKSKTLSLAGKKFECVRPFMSCNFPLAERMKRVESEEANKAGKSGCRSIRCDRYGHEDSANTPLSVDR